MNCELQNNILLRSLHALFCEVGLDFFGLVNSGAELCLFPSANPKFALSAGRGFPAWKNGAELYPGISLAHAVRKAILVAGFTVWRKGRGVRVENMQNTAQTLYRTLSEHPAQAEKIYSFAVRGGSAGAGEKLIFQFQDRAGAPICYVKVADALHRASFLRIEREAFRAIEKSGVGMRTPLVLGYKTLRKFEALELEALKDPRYFPGPGKQQVVTMLADLFIKTSVASRWEAPVWMKDFSILQNQTTRRFIERHMEITRKASFACPLTHRDMAAWNVFLLNGRPGVLDWEYARPAHLPFQDLFHFLLHTKVHSSRKSPVRVYEQVFSSKGNRKFISDYAAAVNLEDSGLIKAIRVAYLWDWFSFERSRAESGCEQGMEYQEILDWLAKNEDRI